jgi:predicted CopG family antitoxin
MVKTLKISDETHRELSKIVGELRALNGQHKTFDDAIRYLIELKKKAQYEAKLREMDAKVK